MSGLRQWEIRARSDVGPVLGYRKSGENTGIPLAIARWHKRGARLDRQKLETILLRRFPGATREQIATSANAIMGLSEERAEVQCHDLQTLAAQIVEGEEFRVLRRRPLPSGTVFPPDTGE